MKRETILTLEFAAIGQRCLERRCRAVGLTLVGLSLLGASPSLVRAEEDERIIAAVLAVDTSLLHKDWQWQFSPEQLGPLAASMLTSELASHRKFRVVERSYIEDVLAEQDCNASGRFDPSTAAAMGQMLGSQLVIVGDIHSFGVKKSDFSGIGGLFGGAGKIAGAALSEVKVKTEIEARLVNASTGEILAVAKEDGDVSSSRLGGMLESATGSASGSISSEQVEGAASEVLREAIADLAEELAKKAEEVEQYLEPIVGCLDGLVAAVVGDQVYLTVGGQNGVLQGDYFEIKHLGAEIKNPATGEVIGTMSESKGFVRVKQVQAAMSIAEIVEGAGFSEGDTVSRGGGPEHRDLQCRETHQPKQRASAGGSGGEGAAAVAGGTAALSGNWGSGGDSGSTDMRTSGRAPSRERNPVGMWRLDVAETSRYWCRSWISGFSMFMPAGEDPCKNMEDEEGWAPMQEGLRGLHMWMEIKEDGTFYAEWKDPRDRALANVSGTWEKEGLYTVLVGEMVDEIPQDNPHREPMQMAEGRLMGQTPELDAQGEGGDDPMGMGMAGFAGWQQLGWPHMDGAAFARES